MIEKIKRALMGTVEREAKVRIIINSDKLEDRVAVMEGDTLEEYNVERPDDDNLVGSVFKGRVKNLEQGLKAMFVDIGFEKNAFLHFWDAIPAALDSGMEEVQRGEGGRGRKQKSVSSKDIPDLYPPGSDIMVQVSKGPIGTKGPRVTTNVTLPGRLLVLMPLNEQFGISRKIEDPKERDRLRKILREMEVPEGMGVILRTVSAGKRKRHLVRDLHFLLEQWEALAEKRNSGKAPVCVFQEPRLIERTVRDFLTEEVDEVICDNLEKVQMMQELAGKISSRARRRITHYQGSRPIFEHYGIERQIETAFHRQVWLPCGGYIVIDETEALIAIDVNSGRNRGGKDQDKLLAQTNIEAAEEVARQLRLRNIGGLVVVDFIDMRSRKDRDTVLRVMKARLKRDKAKTQAAPISQFGLMEMTRQRLNESLRDSLYEACPYCAGRGRIKSTLTLSAELQRKLGDVLGRPDTPNDLLVYVHPDVMERLRTHDSESLVELERRFQGRFTFRADPKFHREQVLIADARTEREVKV